MSRIWRMPRIVSIMVVVITSLCMSDGQPARAENPFSKFLQNVTEGVQKGLAPKPKPTNTVQATGTLRKAANLRTGPGSSNPVVAVLPAGSTVILGGKQGNWYVVQGAVNGKPTGGWVYASLISINDPNGSNILPPVSAAAGMQDSSGILHQSSPMVGTSIIEYAGYSKEFVEIKQMMMDGKLDEIGESYSAHDAEIQKKAGKNQRKFVRKIGLLSWLERGTLAIDQGAFDGAINDFSNAEMILKERNRRSKTAGFFKKAMSATAETFSGNEELQAYEGEGWERVLMLNYKSIAYLLEGDRHAYNVTRRAIDWQNIEKKAFDKRMQKEKGKLKKKIDKQGKGTEEKGGGFAHGITSGLGEIFSPMDAKAKSVPSAYVNPFGFYVAGMVQEFESYNDRSLRDNARISYKKALELNPDSKVIKNAVRELKKPTPPPGTRLVHVIVADGFAPEKKVLTYNVQTGSAVVPLRLPIYTPVPSKIHRIEVWTTSGKRLAVLSSVADVEAICLRQQKDMQPIVAMRAIFSFLVNSTLESTAEKSGGISGTILKGITGAREDNSAPDTRSWMSLPATIQAARIHLRDGVRNLRVVSFDSRGRKVASQSVTLDAHGHAIVYARSMDKVIYAKTAKTKWLAGL